MRMIFYQASCLGNNKNCKYPHRFEVTDAESLEQATRRDFVCAEYRNNYRSNSNFISSNVIALDFDNDMDDEEMWMTPEKVMARVPGACVGFQYSRHHNKEKNKTAPRPRFHAFFLSNPVTTQEEYKAKKERLAAIFPESDDNALDAARFFFGTQRPEVLYFDGEEIDEIFDMYYPEEDWDGGTDKGRVIEQGHRNATMSHFAGKVIKKLGDTEEAKKAFLDESEKCIPPLEAGELNSIWKSAQLFFKTKIAGNPAYLPPEEFNREKQERKYDVEDRTDVGQAELLEKIEGWRLRFTEEMGFIGYNGVNWEESGTIAQKMAQELTSCQLKEAQAEYDRAWEDCTSLAVDTLLQSMSAKRAEMAMDPDQTKAYKRYMAAKEYLTWAEDRRANKNVNGTIEQTKSKVAIKLEELDKNYLLLNTPDGTYDLSKGVRGKKEHDPEDFITKVTAVAPDDKGKELWEDCLQTIFCGDKGLIEYVQMICGLACIGKVFNEHMIISYGDGSNGKSTFWNTVFRVLGTYSGTISAESLTTGCKHNVRPEMAEVKGKRLLLAAELKEGERLNTSMVKKITSTDPIEAEKKFHAPFKFIPSHTLVLYTNHLPRVGAMDNGIWRRLIVVPFKARIEGKNDKKNYGDFLFENAGGAVLKWIMEGAEKMVKNKYKLQTPACVTAAIEEYKGDNDWLTPFIDECCKVEPSGGIKSSELYNAYRAYAMSIGEFVRDNVLFGEALENAGFERKRKNSGVFVRGLCLKCDFS